MTNNDLESNLIGFLQAAKTEKPDDIIWYAYKIGRALRHSQDDDMLRVAYKCMFQSNTPDPLPIAARQIICNLEFAAINLLAETFRARGTCNAAQLVLNGITLIKDSINSYVYKHENVRRNLTFFQNGDYFPCCEESDQYYTYRQLQLLRTSEIRSQLDMLLNELFEHSKNIPKADPKIKAFNECAIKLNQLFDTYQRAVLRSPHRFLEIEKQLANKCKEYVLSIDQLLSQHRTPAWQRFMIGVLGIVASICALGLPLTSAKFRHKFFQTETTSQRILHKVPNCIEVKI